MQGRIKFEWRQWAALLILLNGSYVVSGAESSRPRVDFQRDLRPLLSDKCFFCHGPDEKHREAGLRLDSRSDLFQKGEKGTVVVPGQPEASELWRRITHSNPDQAMPPADSGKKLSDHEKNLIRAWIEQGADWSEHWAFVAPSRPAVPNIDSSWPANSIDRFLLQRMQRAGLTPSPDADPATLVRRYHFDLAGLPPSPDDVAEFEAAFAGSPGDACELLVERLLASPHFGERLAMVWLDLVRYADTVGYHGDQEHHISPYRDYVIQAFCDNIGFDRFTREQLAGDLLHQPTTEQLIATGYNRLLQTSHEGGVQQKEYLAKYSADRVRNFGSVWLGVTLQCAECHDHKFDPLSQRDFYRLAACFADIDDLRTFKGGDSTPTRREPELEVTTRLAPHAPRRTMITVAIAPRPIRVLARGDWLDDSGEIVLPGVPAVFRQVESEGRMTRLDLADWLVSRDNPLTSRVFVNRLWKLFFGSGLAGLDDFGAQGKVPVHPELLDWLSVEFIDSGWDIKHMIRLMVLSHAYRQASLEPSSLYQQDPDNRLLARQSRFRIDAELVRDNVLSISGLLSTSLGGRSVRPYQPDGYYEFLNFPKRGYQPDRGSEQYRRGLYMHWQRAYLHPMLKAFDAPSREECTCERLQSNTPLSALVMLNDPTFVEAARVFAERILNEGGISTGDRVRWTWRTALSRPPTEREIQAVQELLEQERAEFKKRPEGAAELLRIGQSKAATSIDSIELAAWTSVARLLFNLNEFSMRN